MNVDIHSPKDRTISVELPRILSLSRKSIISKTEPGALRYLIEIPALQHLIQHYLLYVEPLTCSKTSHHATARLFLPWANHDTHVFIT